jgi:DNA polymerase-3 subunit delta
MIIFLYGKDTFRSRQHLDELTKNFQQKRDSKGLNTIKIDCTKIKEVGLVWNEVLTVPFLAEKKLIILENFFSAKINDLHKLFLEKANQGFFEKESKNVIFIWDSIDDIKTKIANELFKFLTSQPYSKKFDELKEAEIAGWLVKEAKDAGGSLDGSAAFAIAKNSKDLWQARSLLDQLLDYKAGTLITKQDTALFITEKEDDNIFNLVDGILAKNSQSVYGMIRQQYKIGEDAQFVFAMLLRQCRILFQIKDLFEREGTLPNNILAEKLKLHPFVVKKSLVMVNRYSSQDLKNLYAELLDFDVKTKTGQFDQPLLLDVLVGKLCV